ncbi:DISARM system helicase DrmA [Virgisporangium aurantiacum]|uniref:Helicase n=1 Tax=Virgisporangium aurantiacum TaxID=175570 RepID=A0A8J3Z2K2_9ACTN|nr:DISARM system helicase DrmA [Virgisporangium aurantiacum]GIJ56099.1 helicase [Virgisporangium aurantiacum]
MAGDQGSLFPNPRGEQSEIPLDPTDTPALDLPQRFADATSFQVRDELEALVRKDLLGPWDGDTEVFRPSAMGPRERYLVGMLGPRPRAKGDSPAQDIEVSTAQGDAKEAELPEVMTPQSLGKLWASSMGLSFAVATDVDVLKVDLSWGQYGRQEVEDDSGKMKQTWAREPVERSREVRLDGDRSAKLPLLTDDLEAPGVLLAVDVRPKTGRRIVQLVLINTQIEPSSNGDTAWLFQPRITVTALDGTQAAFQPIDDPADDLAAVGGDLEEAHLRLLYRKQRRYAAGRNVAVHADVHDGQRCAHRLETTWLPTFNVPATVAPSGEKTPLADVELSMDALATAEPATLRTKLLPLAEGYKTWLAEQEATIPTLPVPLQAAAESAVFVAKRAAERIRAGIDLLTDPAQPRHDQALAAFRFANEAMALQRRHTEIGRLREETGLSFTAANQQVKDRGVVAASWRPFQLAFVLLNLPSLTDPAHPERAASHTATVDLLFFPTGGGKTEAYLGLTAFTFAIRRLQGTVGVGADARSGAAGVNVLMRYTLRLLTAQQFQRAAALVCAAEYLRRGDDERWGAEPFRIGLWVGGGVSPNWFHDAEEQIAEAREAADGKRTNVLQTLSCPWCGTKLRAHHDLYVDADRRRVLLHCPNGEGADACPFSRTLSPDGLPILTIDEEIYRYAPSLVIATVDKLAQLPWRGYAGMLFGRVRQWCPRHGYRHDDLDAKTACTGKHHTKGKLPASTSQPVVRLRPPDLIIQDEMHLISGALGTTVGLFEAAVDELCTWPLPGGGETGPKIVASTATTKRAREQVRGVFGRELAVFPPPVIDITDTFFSRQVPLSKENPGRRYLGICAHGVRLKSAEIRLAEILLIAGQTLFDRYGDVADPYMTLVGYFSSTRELAGMRRYLDDQVATRVRTHGRRKDLSDRLTTATQMLTIQELTSRISSADISDVLKRLEIGFDPELDTSVRRRAIADDVREAMKARTTSNPKIVVHPLADRQRDRNNQDRMPVDVVLATSMLQVGVDVSRFGLMVVTGQPKNTAEYIQASSRVGRDAKRPGLVVALYNWTRPRDLAHFEDFEYYHSTFYRQVEALSVTPYTRRSLDRGVAATLVAAVRNVEDAFSRNTDAHDVPLDGPEVSRIVARFLARAEAIGGPRGRDYFEERLKELADQWNQKKTGSTRLGYQASTGKQQLAGLLTPAGGGRWDGLTVGQSMRETENEVNLLVPAGGELFNPLYNAPPWTFGRDDSQPTEEELPAGDEMGESTLSGKAS